MQKMSRPSATKHFAKLVISILPDFIVLGLSRQTGRTGDWHMARFDFVDSCPRISFFVSILSTELERGLRAIARTDDAQRCGDVDFDRRFGDA